MSRARILSLAVAALAVLRSSPVPAEPLRDAARVVAVTRATAYLDAGRDQGLREGLRWTPAIDGQPVTVTVVAVSRTTAVVALDGVAMPLLAGGELPLPPGRTLPPAGPGPRPAPRPTPPWLPQLATDALPRVGAEEGADVVTGASRRRDALLAYGEISARASVGADLGGQSRSSEDVALTNNLSLELQDWTWDHAFDLHYAARPELLSAPLQNGALRFDVYLARLGWASRSGTLAAAVGRMSAAEGTSAGLVDGGRVNYLAAPHVELGAWAGARPDVLDLSPELRAPSAGLVARLGARHPGQLAARADVALAADAWRGSLDRAFADARVGLDLPWNASLEAAGIVDLANDAADERTLRLSRGSVTVRTRFADGMLDARVQGGLADPVLTHSLAERLSLNAPFATDRRHWYGFAGVDLAATDWLLLDLSGRAEDGDDDFQAASADLGVRVLDMGPVGSEAWVRVEALTGTVLEGWGGELGWQAPLAGFAHLEVSYALDLWRIGPSADSSTIHRGRLALQRRFGTRWRTTLSLEGASGGGPARAYGFLLVGYRI